MTLHGYSSVSNDGLIAFEDELLQRAPWAEIQTPSDHHQVCADPSARLSLRADASIKLGLLLAIAALKRARYDIPTTAADIDPKWDREQRLADLDLDREALSEDPARVAAAQLIRDVVFQGHKTGQTSFSYQDEVDFGRHQVAAAQAPHVAQALSLLGMTDRVARIGALTDALSRALGRADQAKALSQYQQTRLSRQHCVAAFNSAHDALSLCATQATTDAARAHFAALLAPFQALLTRHAP